MRYYKWTKQTLTMVEELRRKGRTYEEIINVLPEQEGVTLTAHAVRNAVCRQKAMKNENKQ